MNQNINNFIFGFQQFLFYILCDFMSVTHTQTGVYQNVQVNQHVAGNIAGANSMYLPDTVNLQGQRADMINNSPVGTFVNKFLESRGGYIPCSFYNQH